MSYTKPTIEEVEARRADLAPFDGWNERAFCQIVAWMGIPPHYLDLGSGTGAMVNVARKLGSQAYGVDLINGPEHWFITHDLTTPLRTFEDYRHTFNLITCLEVAEHLPIEAHETLVDTIARHLRPKPNIDSESGYVLFSAAPPGQFGEHHIGNRSAVEWRSLFYDVGLSYREDYTRQIAHLFGYVTGPASHWLAANLMVFDTGTR
jgi:SAM-dependent methyltransferase